jgi:hypothetical protein
MVGLNNQMFSSRIAPEEKGEAMNRYRWIMRRPPCCPLVLLLAAPTGGAPTAAAPRPAMLLQVAHCGGVRTLAYSPDGKALESGNPTDTVRRLGAANGQPEAATAICMRQLQIIGQALKAYQRANGHLPDHLSDLFPQYLRDKMTLHCPADPSDGDLGAQAGRVRPDPKMPVSYLYEMSRDLATFNLYFGAPANGKTTWQQQKLAQRAYFGDRVPAVRCWHHTQASAGQTPLVPAVSLSGRVFCTVSEWELDPATVPCLLTSLERDMAAGPDRLRRRWSPEGIAAYFAAAPSVPALRSRLRAAAQKLTVMRDAFPAGRYAVAVASLYRAAGDVEQAEAVHPTFHLDPPDGTTCLATIRTTRTVSLGSLGKHTLSHEVRQRVRVTRTADGYSYANTDLQGSVIRDGQKEDDAIGMGIGITLTTVVDSQGHIKEIRGIDEVLRQLQDALTAEQRDSGMVEATGEALEQSLRDNWIRRIGSLIGRAVRIGSTWQGTDSLDWPEARARIFYHTTAQVAGREKCGGRECVRIHFTYFQGPALAPVQPARQSARKPRKRELPKSKRSVTPDSALKGGGDLLVDPATMLIYAESLTRTVRMPVQIPGHGTVPGTLVEMKEYRCQYE